MYKPFPVGRPPSISGPRAAAPSSRGSPEFPNVSTPIPYFFEKDQFEEDRMKRRYFEYLGAYNKRKQEAEAKYQQDLARFQRESAPIQSEFSDRYGSQQATGEYLSAHGAGRPQMADIGLPDPYKSFSEFVSDVMGPRYQVGPTGGIYQRSPHAPLGAMPGGHGMPPVQSIRMPRAPSAPPTIFGTLGRR